MNFSREARHILIGYMELAMDVSKHASLIKDETFLLYLAYILDNDDLDMIELGLRVVRLLVNNTNNLVKLNNSFGLLEAIETIKIRFREIKPKVSDSCTELLEDIQRSSDELHRLRYEHKPISNNTMMPKTYVMTLYVQGLGENTRKELEKVLIGIKGVISMVIDPEHQRVTTRVNSNITPKIIAQRICDASDMQAKLIAKNSFNQEVFLDILAMPEDPENISLPSYLPDDDSMPKCIGTVSTIHELKANATNWFNTARSFLQNSFYW